MRKGHQFGRGGRAHGGCKADNGKSSRDGGSGQIKMPQFCGLCAVAEEDSGAIVGNGGSGGVEMNVTPMVAQMADRHERFGCELWDDVAVACTDR
jgi:hypothetical protein